MRKQIIYREKVKKYYLSPYTDVYKISKTNVLMKRCDTGRKMLLKTSTESAICTIISELENGLSDVQVVELLGDRKLFSMFLNSGMIE